MLQKLLIASFAAFLLSACSGSDSSSSETVNDPPPAPDPDNPVEPEEPTVAEVFASMTFGSETSVDSWQVRCADGGNCDADLSHSAEEGVLVVSPAWVTGNDNLEVYTALEEPVVDLTNGSVRVDVRVTEEYLTDGNLRLQVFLENNTNGIAYTGWAEPETGFDDVEDPQGWTRLRFDSIQLNSFSYTSDSFTLQNINAIGVQFVSNGKAAAVGGDFWIDNVRITGPSGDAPTFPTELNPELTDENWTTWDAGDLTVSQSESGVAFSATEGSQKFGYLVQGPLDLGGQSFTVEYTVDQAFLDSGAELQPFAQNNFGGYEGYWSCYISADALPAAGETGTYTCPDLPATIMSDAEGNNIRVGLQVVGAPEGTVTITDLEITIPVPEPVPTEIVPELTDENWTTWDAGDLAVVQSEDGVAFSPTEASQKFGYLAQGPLNLGGQEFTVDYMVDQAFIDSGAELQPFVQNNFGGYEGHWDCYISADALPAAGEEASYTCSGLPDTIVSEAEGNNIRVGMQIVGAAGGTVTITGLEITLPEPAEEPTEVEPELTTENFQVIDGGGETVTVSDAGVSFEPETVDAKLAYLLEGPFDLGGQSFTVEYTVDQAYIDGGADLQPFAQLNFGSYTYFGGCYISNADLVADTPTEFVCEGIDAAIVAAEGETIRVGLQVKGTGGTVTINELVLPIP